MSGPFSFPVQVGGTLYTAVRDDDGSYVVYWEGDPRRRYPIARFRKRGVWHWRSDAYPEERWPTLKVAFIDFQRRACQAWIDGTDEFVSSGTSS